MSETPTISSDFEAGYRKGAADCTGIVAKMDAQTTRIEALEQALRQAQDVMGNPHLSLTVRVRKSYDVISVALGTCHAR